jgi:hypothetical protein
MERIDARIGRPPRANEPVWWCEGLFASAIGFRGALMCLTMVSGGSTENLANLDSGVATHRRSNRSRVVGLKIWHGYSAFSAKRPGGQGWLRQQLAIPERQLPGRPVTSACRGTLY